VEYDTSVPLVEGGGARRAPPPGGPGGSHPDPVVELIGITKAFAGTRALEGVDITFRSGEVHAIVGENGAGKSTLLGILAGFVTPDPPSQVRVAGAAIELAAHSPRRARELGLAMVPQELEVIEPMTVAENIFLGHEPRRGPLLQRREMHRRSRVLLERLGTDVDTHTPVERLSMAQLQLVEIAKALASDSRFLALDEPSAVLAGDELDRLFRVIHQLAEQGVAVAYVSHRLDEIFAHCDVLTVLKDGRVVAGGAVSSFDRATLVRTMVGRPVSDSFPARATSVGDVRLGVRGLSVHGKVHAVGFEVHAGEIVGLAGLIGSGRTTLAKALFGDIPASGEVQVGTERGPFASPREALAAGIAYLPEDRRREGLAIRKRVSTNLSLLALRSIVQGPFGLVSAKAEQDVVASRIRSLDIRTAPDGSDVAAHLSGGNQQKVVLGKWLEAHPRVLILDEPTRGIDVGTKEEIYRLLRELASTGLAILVISSELIEILGLADRILVMSEGRIAGELAGGQATEEQVMRLATATHVEQVA
jgi:ribose transport system ATP-binding protein